MDDVWTPKEEWVVHKSAHTRFRIIRETGDSPFGWHDILRDEKLREQGIDVSTVDAKEVAKALVDTIFQEFSPFCISHLIDALQVEVVEFEARTGRKVREC